MLKSFYVSLTKSRLFLRILFYFLSLLLPLVIISMIFYYNFQNKVMDDFEEKIEINLQASANMTDTLVNTAQEISAAFFYETGIRSLLLPYDLYPLESRTRLQEIRQELVRISTSIWYSIDSILVFADDKKIYTAQGLTDFHVYLTNWFKYEKYDSAYWESRLSITRPFEILPASDLYIQGSNKKRVIPIVISDIINDHRVVMVVNITTEMIKRNLEENAILESSQHMVLDREGNIIVGTEQAYSHIHADDDSMLVIQRTSQLYGWEYYSITPVDELGDQLKDIRNWLAALCISLIIAGICLSFAFAYNLYKPIRNIRNILIHNTDVVKPALSGTSTKNNEMDDIGVGVARLIHYSDSYKDKLDAISVEYANHAFINLLKNHRLPNLEEIVNKLELSFSSQGSLYTVCCVQLTYKEALDDELSELLPATLHKKLTNMIYSILLQEVALYMIEVKAGLLAFIVNLKDPKDRNHLINALQLILIPFQHDKDYCEVHIGAGGNTTTLAHIHKSYNEAMTALENSKKKGQFHITDAQLLDICHEYYYSLTDENKIINGLKSGDMTFVAEIISDILEENRNRGVSYEYMHLLITEMYYSGQRFASERELAWLTLISEQEQRLLKNNELVDLSEKVSLLLDFLQATIDSSQEQTGTRGSEWIGEIMRYIDENYKQDLYLEKIAERFQLSAKYVSRIFKEQTGMNVTDYVSKVRIDEAKKMISGTDRNIMHIAEDVGIFSRTTFIRLFKKYEGITPNEYRKLTR